MKIQTRRNFSKKGGGRKMIFQIHVMYRVLYFNEAQYFSGDIPFPPAPCSLPFQPLRPYGLSRVFLHRFYALHFNRSANPGIKKMIHTRATGMTPRWGWGLCPTPLLQGLKSLATISAVPTAHLFVIDDKLFYSPCPLPPAPCLLLSFRPWRHPVYPPYSSFP